MSAIADVLEGRARWAVEQGDCLDVLRAMPDASVDAVITDPPYSSGGAFRGDRTNATGDKYGGNRVAVQRADFAGDNRDQRSFSYWCALWLSECLRIAKPGAPVCLFTDWRQLPTTTDAMQAGGWVWRGIAPWDKTEGVRPVMGRFRAQCEYVVWGSAGAMPLREDVGVLPGVFRTPVLQADKHHQTGKPSALMAQIARIVPPDGIVLDPFFGSGSTGVGALRAGRRVIGIEKTDAYYPIAVERCRKAADPGQSALFAGDAA